MLNDVIRYILTFSDEGLTRFSCNSASSYLIFRLLPILSRNIIYRLMLSSEFVREDVLKSLFTDFSDEFGFNYYLSDLSSSLILLAQLRLISRETSMEDSSAVVTVTLSAKFKKNFLIAIRGGGPPWFGYVDDAQRPKRIDISDLQNFSDKKWNNMLTYIINSQEPQCSSKISQDVKSIIKISRLIQQGDDGLAITLQGFNFLLKGRPQQVLMLIFGYFRFAEKSSMDIINCFIFLIQISQSIVAKPYPTSSLTSSQETMLRHLHEMGLAYHKEGHVFFYVTPAVVNIFTDSSEEHYADESSGFLIIETNFRICSYSASPIDEAILGLFAELHNKLPGLIVAYLTRLSVGEAIKHDIEANQIISYLEIHAHPLLRAHGGLPVTVKQQILLWESEKKRLKHQEAHLLSNFESRIDYQNLKKYSESLDSLSFSNDSQMILVIKSYGYKAVKEKYMSSKKK